MVDSEKNARGLKKYPEAELQDIAKQCQNLLSHNQMPCRGNIELLSQIAIAGWNHAQYEFTVRLESVALLRQNEAPFGTMDVRSLWIRPDVAKFPSVRHTIASKKQVPWINSSKDRYWGGGKAPGKEKLKERYSMSRALTRLLQFSFCSEQVFLN
jgi:hypothetical protein